MTQSVLSFLGLVFIKARHVNFALGTSAGFFFGREGNFTTEEVSGGFLLWGGGRDRRTYSKQRCSSSDRRIGYHRFETIHENRVNSKYNLKA